MVAFTDQFERRDPLTFNAYGSVMNLWPRQLAWEARRLVATRSVIDLTEIGRAIDRVVWRAAEATIDRGPRSIAESRQHPPKTSGLLTPREHSARAIGEVRHVDGDLNLYREAGGIGELLRDPALARLIPTDWEAYATIALWKLVDLYEHLAAAMERDEEGRVVSSLYRQDDPDHLRRSRSGLRYASEEAIEAACACTLASEARLRHDIAAVLTAATDQQAARVLELERAEHQRQQSTRAMARQASTARWSARDGHRERALALAQSRPFSSRSEAARFAMERIEKTPEGETYTFETVDSWLKAAGWKAAD